MSRQACCHVQSGHSSNSSTSSSSSDPHWLQALRWVFGGIVCVQNTEFLERQASLLGTAPGVADSGARSAAIAELYDDLGDSWRRYQCHMDRKRKTTHLTCALLISFLRV